MIETRLRAAIWDVLDETGSWPIEMEVMPDHVHLLVEVDPLFQFHGLVKVMKGRSRRAARLLRQEFPVLKTRLHFLDGLLFRRDRGRRTVVCDHAVCRESEKRMSGDRGRKRSKGVPTHVRIVPLRLTPTQRAVVETRFHAGARVYNACLAEALRRGELFRTDPAFGTAKTMEPGKARTEAFAALRAAHGFTAWSVQTVGSGIRQSWVREQVMSQETQLLAARAYGAVNRWHVGEGGKPRFKSTRITSRRIRSLGGKDLFGALRTRMVDGRLAGLAWGKGVLLAAAPITSTGRKGRDQRAERAAIERIITDGEVLSCRIVKTMIRGRATYQAQLICDGHPPVRHPVGTGQVSIDLGPSTVAVVTAQNGLITSAGLEPLALGLVTT